MKKSKWMPGDTPPTIDGVYEVIPEYLTSPLASKSDPKHARYCRGRGWGNDYWFLDTVLNGAGKNFSKDRKMKWWRGKID